jgi:hypothetical protein
MKAAKLRQLYKGLGKEKTVAHLRENLEAGHLRVEDFSIKDLFEGLVVDRHGNPIGRDVVLQFAPGNDFNLVEAAHAVDTSVFSNVSGQIVFSKILEAYNDPQYLADQLCTTVPTRLSGEKIPGVVRLGDESEAIDEGAVYPTLGLGEDWIETPETVKRGFIVPVTKEAIFFDRTGLVLKRAGESGHWLAVKREKLVMDVVTGQTNTYKWKGTTYTTYVDTPWDNLQASNALADWTDIENAELLFDGMTDPGTGEPIMVVPNVLLVPTALKHTANRIISATEVQHVDNQANAMTYRTSAGNPMGNQYKVVSSPMVKVSTSSATTWFIGDPKKAFLWMENWGITTQQAPSNSEPEFTQDIVTRFKVSFRGVPAIENPRYMVKCTA